MRLILRVAKRLILRHMTYSTSQHMTLSTSWLNSNTSTSVSSLLLSNSCPISKKVGQELGAKRSQDSRASSVICFILESPQQRQIQRCISYYNDLGIFSIVDSLSNNSLRYEIQIKFKFPFPLSPFSGFIPTKWLKLIEIDLFTRQSSTLGSCLLTYQA